jgi:uncharacterized protein YjbJ (UPF0337 family)
LISDFTIHGIISEENILQRTREKEGVTMKASTKDRLEGTYHEIKGAVRVAIGKAVNSPRVAIAGHVEKAAGTVQVKVGKAERVIGR